MPQHTLADLTLFSDRLARSNLIQFFELFRETRRLERFTAPLDVLPRRRRTCPPPPPLRHNRRLRFHQLHQRRHHPEDKDVNHFNTSLTARHAKSKCLVILNISGVWEAATMGHRCCSPDWSPAEE